MSIRTVFITLILIVAIWLIAVVVLMAVGRRSAARELATLIPNLLLLFRGLVRDARVSRGSKAWLWFAIAWLISPIDLIPEFIPVVGPLDDAIVAALVLRHVLKRTDRVVLSEHWHGEDATLAKILRFARAG